MVFGARDQARRDRRGHRHRARPRPRQRRARHARPVAGARAVFELAFGDRLPVGVDPRAQSRGCLGHQCGGLALELAEPFRRADTRRPVVAGGGVARGRAFAVDVPVGFVGGRLAARAHRLAVAVPVAAFGDLEERGLAEMAVERGRRIADPTATTGEGIQRADERRAPWARGIRPRIRADWEQLGGGVAPA